MKSLFIQPQILDGNKISYEYVINRVEVEKAFKKEKTNIIIIIIIGLKGLSRGLEGVN